MYKTQPGMTHKYKERLVWGSEVRGLAAGVEAAGSSVSSFSNPLQSGSSQCDT